MKYFALQNKTVQLAPGTKIIPKKSLSQLVSSKELWKQVEIEAEALREKTLQECEELKKQAIQQGFEEGLTSLNKHLLAVDQELKALRHEVQDKILPLTLSAAKKILGEELKLHPERIVDIVLTALKPVTQHRNIVLYLNKEDLAMMEKNRAKVKEIFEHLDTLSIQERDDVQPGGCIIQTEAGIINAQLETQWRALEAAFAQFMKK